MAQPADPLLAVQTAAPDFRLPSAPLALADDFDPPTQEIKFATDEATGHALWTRNGAWEYL